MARAERVIQTTATTKLYLTFDEAQWLKAYTQNCVHDTEEVKYAEYREAVFNALNEPTEESS